MPEQRFVGDRHDGAAVVRELGDEQPILDERIDERAALAGEAIGPRCALAADRFVTVLLDAHERVQDFRQFGLHVGRQILEHRFGALRERAFDAAQARDTRPA